jgi:hypothetical protein
MDPSDIAKTAIITPFGLFEYLFMPFGLTNAAQTFQRLMDRLFGHLPFVFTYLDDHLIASTTMEEHLEHLRIFFEILRDNGLTIKPSKCSFAVSSVKFLGHMVSESGVVPLPRHVEAISGFPRPTDLRQLQRFLGLINFYRRFLPAIAGVLKPLTDLLRGAPKKLLWSSDADAAFTKAKAALVAAIPLSHPAPGAVLSLAVDASDTHVGGVLQQLQGRSWQPLAFFSKKLSPTQVRYSTFDRELLAAFSAVRHFRFLLEGRRFRLMTDHKPLVAAMSRVSPPWSARQQRQMAYLAEFTADFRHTPGATNDVADALSRPPAPSTGTPAQQVPASQILPPCAAAKAPVAALPSGTRNPPPDPPRSSHTVAIQELSPPETQAHTPPAASPSATPFPAVAAAQPLDFASLAAAQHSCPDVASMRASTALSIVSKPIGEHQLLGDVSTGEFRPLLVPQFRAAAFLSLHNIAHPGNRATCRLVSSRFCWPQLSKQVAAMAWACLHCQRSKVHKHVHLQPEQIEIPRRRFAHVHVDLVGPLPRSAGFSYLLTVLDRTTRWPEAIPLAAVTAADCAAGFFHGWVQRFGLPATITSDRGPQFASSLWSALCSLLNIIHLQTTSYHPQANGAVERFHRRLKDALRARTAGADWHAHLPWVLLGIRSAWRENSSFSPAEAVFRAQLVLPGQFLNSPEPSSPTFLQELQRTLNNRPPPSADHHNRPGPLSLPEELLLTRFVQVRRDGAQPPLSPMYDGPYLVLERSLRFFKIQVGTRQDTVSTLRLKPCRSPPDAQPAVPPRRGRPPMGPAAASSSADVPRPPATRRRRVTFRCPVVVPPPESPPPPPLLHPSGRPARRAGPPQRYLSSLDSSAWGDV